LERSIERVHTEPDSGIIQLWIQEAQRGDVRSFDRLARHFLPRMRRWALVRTGDPDEADDVVQRTLVQMYRKLGRYRGDAAFASWIYRIAANEAHGQFRHAKAQARLLERLRAERDEGASGAERVFPGEGVTDLVRIFLTELSGRQREMMDLVDFQGFTPAEAAGMLGLNQNTARVHLLRARRRIRTRILDEHAKFEEEAR
jgi:RNA polymerase sigma-70 factor, ECF subfamily